ALPADHTRGTYWYHPHHHGSADVQVASGMAGAIIVEGDFADVPEIAQARERVMLLTQVVFDAFYMIEDFGTLFPETSTRFLAINGQRRPTIDMRPGEVQRWRLVGSQYQDNMPPSRWTEKSSTPRASTSGCGWARWRNGRSATPTSTTIIC